jgi:Zn-dependent peptidase ImmA (M78 family)
MKSKFLKSRTVRYFVDRYKRTTIKDAVEVAANMEREVLLTGCEDFCTIPVNVNEIAKRKGLDIREHSLGSKKIDSAIRYVGNRYAVVLSDDQPASRGRMSISHEIGHKLFRSGPKHSVGLMDSREREYEDRICKMFASALLMPKEHLKSFLNEIPDETCWQTIVALENIARRFQVSLPSLVLRIGSLGIKSKVSLICICLKRFNNKFTNMEPKLRVESSFSLGALKGLYTWYNYSAKSLQLESAERLFSKWSEQIGLEGEPTGGRYVLDEDDGILRADSNNLCWDVEEINISRVEKKKWFKEKFRILGANYLYAARGWGINETYIIFIGKPIKKQIRK